MLKRIAVIAVVVTCLAVVALLAGCPGGREQAQAPSLQTEAGGPVAEIIWLRDLADARSLAVTENKPIMIDFYADWCGPCKLMERETWPSAEVAQAAAGFLPVKVNVDQNQALANEFGVSAIPTIVFLNKDGETIKSHRGFADASKMVKLIENARRAAG